MTMLFIRHSSKGGVGLSLAFLSLVAGLLLKPALAFEGKPKLGPNAVPILEQTAYLRTAPTPDYWTLSPFYVSQTISSDCSVASITMAISQAVRKNRS